MLQALESRLQVRMYRIIYCYVAFLLHINPQIYPRTRHYLLPYLTHSVLA